MTPSNGYRRILAAQLARFGDFLQTTPLLAALKARYPEAELTVLVAGEQETLAAANPDVDRVLTVDLSALRGAVNRKDLSWSGRILELHDRLAFLRNQAYDLVLNLNTSRLAALLCDLAPGGERRGPRLAANRTDLKTAPFADYIMVLMTRRRLIRFNLVDLLAGYLPEDAPMPRRLTFPLTVDMRSQGADLLRTNHTGTAGPLIGFQLGSRHISRQWPPDHFARLAALLADRDQARIVFLGMESERKIGAAVMDRLIGIDPRAAAGVIDLMGKTSIPQLAGVLSRLDLLVTTDTGTMHLAAAVQTPILGLFIGPAFCHETGPYGDGHLILQTGVPCSPCTEDRPWCLRSDRETYFCRHLIDPETAYEAAGLRLGRDIRPDLRTGGGVRLLVSRFDRFGVVYDPLTRPVLEVDDVLAAAYREAGRTFIRPGYRIDREALLKEFEGYERPEADASQTFAAGLAGLQTGLRVVDHGERNLEHPDLSPFYRIYAGLVKQGQSDRAARVKAGLAAVMDAAAAWVRVTSFEKVSTPKE